MSTVGAAAHLRGAVHLNVGQVEGVDLEALGLGVGLGVAEEVEEVGAGLDGQPAALPGAFSALPWALRPQPPVWRLKGTARL